MPLLPTQPNPTLPHLTSWCCSAEDRAENIRRIGEMAKVLADNGVITLVSSLCSEARAGRGAPEPAAAHVQQRGCTLCWRLCARLPCWASACQARYLVVEHPFNSPGQQSSPLPSLPLQTSFISPYRADRERVRQRMGVGGFLVRPAACGGFCPARRPA